MPARKHPPEASADRVRDLFRVLTAIRDSATETEEQLYAAVYQASLDGWSDGALGKKIGVPRGTVQGWRENGRRLVENT